MTESSEKADAQTKRLEKLAWFESALANAQKDLNIWTSHDSALVRMGGANDKRHQEIGQTLRERFSATKKAWLVVKNECVLYDLEQQAEIANRAMAEWRRKAEIHADPESDARFMSKGDSLYQAQIRAYTAVEAQLKLVATLEYP